MENSEGQYQWIRHWIPVGTSFPKDHFGFPASKDYHGNNVGLTLKELNDTPCLMLLGQPSLGKTTEVKNFAIGPESLICKYNLNRSSSEHSILSGIEALPEFQIWLNESKRLYLFLDGLDEAFLNVKTIHNAIADWLQRNKVRFRLSDRETLEKCGLFLRITCRSAIWTLAVTNNLIDIYKNENVKNYELLPLNYNCIVTAAAYENIDVDEFVDALSASHTIGFVQEPVICKILIDRFKAGALGSSNLRKEDLYFDLCRSLAEEKNPIYKGVAALPSHHRIAIASRIAMYLMISNYKSVSKEVTLSTSENCLTFDDIVRDEFVIDGHKFNIATDEIKEVVNTRLFTLTEDDKLCFAHKSFGEFLAAWHLNKLELQAKQLNQVLTSPFDAWKAIPQLQEVSSWLVSLSDEFYSQIYHHDPYLVLGSSRSLTDAEKKNVTMSLFNLASKYQIIDRYDFRQGYLKLKFSGLPAIVKSYLTAPHNTVCRRIAIDISGACKLKEMIPLLLIIANNKNEEYYLRKECVIAIGDIGDLKKNLSLKKFALENNVDDVDDELKGSALNVLYPSHLSFEQLIEVLTPIKRDNLYGAYRGFLHRIPQLIPERELISAVQVLFQSSMSNQLPDRVFDEIATSVVERAFEYATSDAELNMLADVFCELGEILVSFEFNDPEKRRKIFKRIINAGSRDKDRFNSRLSLVRPEDWDWVIESYEATNSIEEKLQYSDALWTMFDFKRSERVVQFLELIFQCPEVRQRFYYFIDAVDMNSEAAKDMQLAYGRRTKRSQRENSKKQKQLLALNVPDKVQEYLDRFSEDNLDPWWQIISVLRIDDTAAHYSEVHEFEFNIVKLPGWKRLSIDIQTKLLTVAKIYLDKYKPNHSWIDGDRFYRPEIAIYKSILLLQEFNPAFIGEINESEWRRWYSTVIYCSFQTLNDLPENQKLVLRLCSKANASSDEFYKAIESFLKKRVASNHDLYDLYKITDIIGVRLFNVLRRLFAHKSSSSKQQDYILDALFKSQPRLAKEYCLECSRKLFKEEKEINRPLLVKASAKLLQNVSNEEWAEFWALMKKDSTTARQVFIEAAPNLGYGDSRSIKGLQASQRGELLKWLYVNFTTVEKKNRGIISPVSEIDGINDFKSQVLRSLIDEGSVEAVDTLKKIDGELKSVPDFKWWIVSAREQMWRNTWVPIIPMNFRRVLIDASIRFVRSELELLAIVEESLQRLEVKLQGKNPTALFLWDNRSSRGAIKYVHKDENSLSDFVKMHLEYDLVGNGLVINREVEIKRSTGKKDGERTDLLVQVYDKHNKNETMISLVIETKGCWNWDEDDNMTAQLKNRYMKRHKAKVGMFLIGWFYCKHFKPSKSKELGRFKEIIAARANQLSEHVTIKALVLNCTI